MQKLFFLTLSLFVSAAGAVDFRQEIGSLLERAKRAHENATSYGAWHESDYHPDEIAEEFRRKSHDKSYTQALCVTLNNTQAVDLFYVADYLDEAGIQTPCLEYHHARYSKYLLQAQKAIRDRYSDQPTPMGPSRNVWIDPSSTPLIVDGGLPDKTIALTFDDGPHHSRTADLLKILGDENLQVNFFLVGQNALVNRTLVRAENMAGHEIGTHTYSHPDLRKLKLEEGVEQIERAFRAVFKALGVERTMFRFPYGASTRDLRAYLHQTGTPEFFWNIDTWDWQHKDPLKLIDFALKQVRLKGHGVVLMHDIQPQTIAIMPGFLAALKQEGYKNVVFRPTITRTHPSEVKP